MAPIQRWAPPDADAKAAAPPQQSAARIEPKSGLEFLWIRGGSFQYGCGPRDPEPRPGEACRRVTIDGFWMGRTEVSVKAYARCVQAGACERPMVVETPQAWATWCNWGVSGRENHPVNCVHWNHAAAFCEWIGGSLPTSEQWESAAKGGEDRTYPWGDRRDDALYNTTHNGTVPVDAFPAGATKDGLLQMAGNVWEWTSSDYTGPDPVGGGGVGKELRGGSWNRPRDWMRTSKRTGDLPDKWNDNSGFRCIH